jgi:hypothetical protein
MAYPEGCVGIAVTRGNVKQKKVWKRMIERLFMHSITMYLTVPEIGQYRRENIIYQGMPPPTVEAGVE